MICDSCKLSYHGACPAWPSLVTHISAIPTRCDCQHKTGEHINRKEVSK